MNLTLNTAVLIMVETDVEVWWLRHPDVKYEYDSEIYGFLKL